MNQTAQIKKCESCNCPLHVTAGRFCSDYCERQSFNPAERVDHLLDRLDVENDDQIRADLIDELIGLGDKFPEIADRVRAGGVSV